MSDGRSPEMVSFLQCFSFNNYYAYWFQCRHSKPQTDIYMGKEQCTNYEVIIQNVFLTTWIFTGERQVDLGDICFRKLKLSLTTYYSKNISLNKISPSPFHITYNNLELAIHTRDTQIIGYTHLDVRLAFCNP